MEGHVCWFCITGSPVALMIFEVWNNMGQGDNICSSVSRTDCGRKVVVHWIYPSMLLLVASALLDQQGIKAREIGSHIAGPFGDEYL